MIESQRKRVSFMKRLVLSVATLILFSSCAHHDDVRPGIDGVNRVVLVTDNPDSAARDAIAQANDYCEQFKKTPAIIKEDKKYTGDMDKSTYDTTKTAAKVAKAVGGTTMVFGGKNEKNAGGVVGLGGIAADAAAGNGYTVEMQFKCVNP